VLGSTVAFCKGMMYSELDATHQLYMLLPSITCPELKHATISNFIQQHTVLSASAALSGSLSPNTYSLNDDAWKHAHSLLSHTVLHNGSSLLSLARAQFDARTSRDSASFEDLVRGFSTQSSSSLSPLSLQILFPKEALLLLKATLVDLWQLVQVISAACFFF
jgi:hypothetical protein